MKKNGKWVALALVAVLACGVGVIWGQINPVASKTRTLSTGVETIGNEGTVKLATIDVEQLLTGNPPPSGLLDPDAYDGSEPMTITTLKGIMTYNDDPAEALKCDTRYTLVLGDLPEKFLETEEQSVAVVYPATIAAGDIGKFQVYMKIGERYYCAALAVTTEDDVQLVHGSANPDTYSGSELYYNDQTKMLELHFYTSATEEYLRRPRTVERYSSHGHPSIRFTRVIGM